LLTLHRAKCPGVEEPLEDFRTALAQGIVQALLDSCAETIQRNTKSRNANFRHMSASVAGLNSRAANPDRSRLCRRLDALESGFAWWCRGDTTKAGKLPAAG
jgi:hypothetical protein